MQTYRAFFCVEADLFIAKGSNKPSRDTRGDIIATGNDVFSRSTPSPPEKFRSRQIVFFGRKPDFEWRFFLKRVPRAERMDLQETKARNSPRVQPAHRQTLYISLDYYFDKNSPDFSGLFFYGIGLFNFKPR